MILSKVSRYNVWGDDFVLPQGYVRELYMGKLRKYIGSKLVKVLVGQRRSGKSFILRQLMVELQQQGVEAQQILYINKELVAFDEIKTYLDVADFVEKYRTECKVTGKLYLFLDEVQEIVEWERIVASLSQDFTQECEVFISGSNSNLLAGELATLLSGRFVEFEVYPFLYFEYCDYLELIPGKKSLDRYLQTSGLPELFHLPNDELVRHYIYSLKDTIVLKDIVKRYNLRNVHLLDRIFRFLTNNIGNTFSLSSIVAYLKSHGEQVSHETVGQYVEHLLTSVLFFEAERWDLQGKKILKTDKKYYLNDLGFRNYFAAQFDPFLCKQLENAVYLYFRACGFTVYTGRFGDKEIDFVLEKDDQRQYVQVAYSLSTDKVVAREFGNLALLKDHFPKMVVSMEEGIGKSRDGILHRTAWQLLGEKF